MPTDDYGNEVFGGHLSPTGDLALNVLPAAPQGTMHAFLKTVLDAGGHAQVYFGGKVFSIRPTPQGRCVVHTMSLVEGYHETVLDQDPAIDAFTRGLGAMAATLGGEP